MIYLASPYSHPDPAVRDARFRLVCKIAGEMIAKGNIVFSPIAHSHCIQTHSGTDFYAWSAYDRHMILISEAVYVATMEGWLESIGVQAEIEYAKSLGKFIRYIAV